VPRRVVIALLEPVTGTPEHLDPGAWRTALAEDLIDLLGRLNEVDVAVAVAASELAFAESVRSPGMTIFPLDRLCARSAFAAASAAGFDHAGVLAPDAPDLPGLLVGKLMRAVGRRPLAALPQLNGPGLVGLAATLPAPAWLPELPLSDLRVTGLRAGSGSAEIGETPGWRRITKAADTAWLDLRLDGAESVQALLAQ